MEHLHLREHVGEFGERAAFEAGAELGVGGHFGQLEAVQKRFDVHAGAAADDWQAATRTDVGNGGAGVAQVLKEVVLIPGVGDVDKVERYFAVFVEVLAGAEVHGAVDLARIGGDDFAVESAGALHGAGGFAAGGRTGDDKQGSIHIRLRVKMLASV